MLNKSLFSKNFTGICELFDKQASDTLTSIYYESLKVMTDQEFKTAITRIITTSKFFPKPADFLEAIRMDESAQAILAYEKAVTAGRQHGCYRSVKFDDPAIHSTIELMGGWQQFCLSEDSRKWQQKEFEKIYPVMLRRGSHPKYLPGQSEERNALTGHKITSPVLIGERLQLQQTTKKELWGIEP